MKMNFKLFKSFCKKKIDYFLITANKKWRLNKLVNKNIKENYLL